MNLDLWEIKKAKIPKYDENIYLGKRLTVGDTGVYKLRKVRKIDILSIFVIIRFGPGYKSSVIKKLEQMRLSN